MNTVAIAANALLAAWHIAQAIPDDGTPMTRHHRRHLATAAIPAALTATLIIWA